MRRLVPFLVAAALVAAACGPDDTETAETTTVAPPTSAAPTTTDAPTTTLPPDPEPWWNDRVFYEIFVRSFQDSNDDGIGDIEGLISRLDYLNDGDPTTTTDLGITGIWLMPIMSAESYHGYDVLDYRRVDRLLGDEDTFRRFMDEAHERGIAVIIDLVLNHTGKAHPWFAQSFLGNEPYDDWYLWSDEPGEPPEAWHRTATGRNYFGIFWEGMPDLNLENPEVTAELYDIAEYWLTEFGVDGFRLDAVKHFIEDGIRTENTQETRDWTEAFNDHVHATNPAAITVGEIWAGTSNVAAYVPEQLDLAFEFTLASAMLDEMKKGRSNILRRFQQEVLDAFPPNQYAAFLTNHDQNRVIDVLFGDFERAELAATLLLTNPGVPFVYYGEEIGLSGSKPDPRIRTPMPWDATDGGGFTTATPHEAFADGKDFANVATQTDDPDSLLSHYRELIHLRNASEALRRGGMEIIDAGDDALYAYVRATDAERVLVLMNFGREPVTTYDLSTAGQTGEVLLGPSWSPGDPIPPRSSFVIALNG